MKAIGRKFSERFDYRNSRKFEVSFHIERKTYTKPLKHISSIFPKYGQRAGACLHWPCGLVSSLRFALSSNISLSFLLNLFTLQLDILFSIRQYELTLLTLRLSVPQ
jgi:hypothetical protein